MTNEKKAHYLANNYADHERLTLETAILEALDQAFNAGMNHVSVDRNKVSVHGTDGCMNCETGRITIYAGHRWCIKCQHASAPQ